MATRKEMHQEKIKQLMALIEMDIDSPVNEGNFAIWGAENYLQSVSDPPTADELEERSTDGSDDYGLDMYFVDDEERTVHLIQSKLRRRDQTIRRAELDSLFRLPKRLMDPGALSNNSNWALVEFAGEFRELIKRGYGVGVIYLTTQRATPQIEGALLQFNRDSLELIEGVDCAHFARIFGVDDLISAAQAYDNPTDTEISLLAWFEDSDPNGANRHLSGMVSADELLRIFNQHGYGVFRLNPRGPLGVVKVNKEIQITLKSDEDRPRFFFLNNGLTAVCTSFKERNDQAGTFDVHELQIVNGCQTTWTLYDHQLRGGSLADVSLSIKLIETAASNALAEQISRASNSQSPMQDWDFLFNEPEQRRLKREFLNLPEPIVYELRRGEQRFIDRSSGRKTRIKDVAQAMWAFMGHPGEARDRLREIPRMRGNAYREVFFDGVTARHLWLPYEVHERVKQEYKNRTSSVVAEAGQNNRRLHLVWLIGELIIKALEIDSYLQIDTGSLSRVSRGLNIWFNRAYDLADYAIDDTIDFYKDEEGELQESLRQLYRASRFYDRYLVSLERVMRMPLYDFEALKADIVGRER
jgi:hypothetical protein